MALKPAVQPPRGLPPGLEQTINNIRERFVALEAQVVALQALIDGNTTGKAITLLQQQINSTTEAASNPDGTTALALLNALLGLANGFVVVRDGTLVTRTLQPGPGIFITYPDGFSGNPIISLVPTPDVVPLAFGASDDYDWFDDTDQDAPTEFIEPLLSANAPAALAYLDLDLYDWWQDVDIDEMLLFIDQTPIPSASQSFPPSFDDGFEWSADGFDMDAT